MSETTITRDTTEACLTALMGLECVCGAPKRSKYSFCRSCYYKLPPELRTALYARVRHGYEQAFLAACEFLNTLCR